MKTSIFLALGILLLGTGAFIPGFRKLGEATNHLHELEARATKLGIDASTDVDLEPRRTPAKRKRAPNAGKVADAFHLIVSHLAHEQTGDPAQGIVGNLLHLSAADWTSLVQELAGDDTLPSKPSFVFSKALSCLFIEICLIAPFHSLPKPESTSTSRSKSNFTCTASPSHI